jgi:hypothetical protein
VVYSCSTAVSAFGFAGHVTAPYLVQLLFQRLGPAERYRWSKCKSSIQGLKMISCLSNPPEFDLPVGRAIENIRLFKQILSFPVQLSIRLSSGSSSLKEAADPSESAWTAGGIVQLNTLRGFKYSIRICT